MADVEREQVEWSCGCTTAEPVGYWEVGHWGRCDTHSAIVGYDPQNGDPELDRDVQVVSIPG